MIKTEIVTLAYEVCAGGTLHTYIQVRSTIALTFKPANTDWVVAILIYSATYANIWYSCCISGKITIGCYIRLKVMIAR